LDLTGVPPDVRMRQTRDVLEANGRLQLIAIAQDTQSAPEQHGKLDTT